MMIAGVDEAGRGPWAGPVVAAAVILNEVPPGLSDSKKLTEKKREALYDLLLTKISDKRIIAGVGLATVAEIDQHNILQATFRAMRRAVMQCNPLPSAIWVDGPYLPFVAFCEEDWHKVPNAFVQESQAIIKGDAQYPCIAAASILAKVHRDRIMLDYDQRYPQYGFAHHKGYGTAEHRSALLQWGPCPIHRQSFAPIKAMIR